jgi:hypothetical protein
MLLDLSPLDPPLEVVEDQLKRAKPTDNFDAIRSADQVKALKPRHEPDALSGRTFDVALADVWLGAAHNGDVAPAQLSPTAPKPISLPSRSRLIALREYVTR